jgi:O-antigen/teichoic acid export membrane protein
MDATRAFGAPDGGAGSPSQHPPDPSVVTNTALALTSQLVTALLTAFLVLYMTRALGPRSYGEFALAVGVAGVVLLPADFGVSSSAARFIAERRRDRKAASEFLSNALALKLAAAVISSGALFVLAGPLAGAYGDSNLAWPFRAMAVVLFGQSMMALYSSALIAVGRISSNLLVYSAESVAEVLGSVVLVALGGGATGAAFGRATGYVVGVATAAALAYRAFGRPALAPRSPTRVRIAQIARYAGVLFVVDSGWTLFSQIDVLLIGAFVGSAQVAFFSVPLRLCALLHYPGLALSSSVSPRLARTAGAEPDTASFQAAVRYLIILEAGLVAPILVWAGPIVYLLLGARYGPSIGVLRALAPYVLLQGVGSLVSVGVNYLGESRRRLRIVYAAFLIDLVIDLILIPRIGALAGAIATSAAFAVYVPAHLLICTNSLSISVRPILLTLTRALLAAAGAAGVLLLVGTSRLSAVDWLVGASGSIVAFVAILFALRELTRADVVRARRIFGELMPQPRRR